MVSSGTVEIVTSDGEKRRWTAGQAVVADDLIGKGHRTKWIEGTSRAMFIEPPPTLDFERWTAFPAGLPFMPGRMNRCALEPLGGSCQIADLADRGADELLKDVTHCLERNISCAGELRGIGRGDRLQLLQEELWSKARQALVKGSTRGTERIGLVASPGAARLKAEVSVSAIRLTRRFGFLAARMTAAHRTTLRVPQQSLTFRDSNSTRTQIFERSTGNGHITSSQERDGRALTSAFANFI